MTSSLLTLVLLTTLGSLDDGPAAELRYRGILTPLAGNADAEPVKEFSIYVLVKNEAEGRRTLGFVVDEHGGGGWAWPERFGEITINGDNQPAGDAQIRVLHEHNETKYPLSVRQPLFEHFARITEGAEWTADELDYRVVGKATIANRKCWQVEAQDRFQNVQTIWVEEHSPLVVACERQVVMGRGDRFRLETELESVSNLDAAQLQAVERPLQTLLKLQSDLNREASATNPDLNERQLTAATPYLQSLAEQANDTPFADLATAIGRDVEQQQKRSANFTELARKLVGQPSPELRLEALNGDSINPLETGNQIVVLHFWKYHGDPPEEPYGQVGYLDFLNGRRGKLGVQVHGVAVDPTASEPAQRAVSVRRIRKLAEFMNLSYPVAIDDGTLLSKFGDPRQLGANLPLWVVIAPDSTVAHYHVGFYEIQPHEGLRELDEVVAELLKKHKPSE